ncbi:acyltransferase [Rhodococcus globerulus]|uniref:acyltransferase n=1 Tax=Rhodococcus globerulus TaxID=33008 RepID=UPI00374E8AB2
MRWKILRMTGANICKSYIAPGLFFGGSGLNVARGAILNYDCFIDATGRVDICENASIGPQSTILTVTHHISSHVKRRGEEQIVLPTYIGTGAWLGARVTVLPGCRIGSGCVIAAGSVVTEDCDDNWLYAGVPAKKIREL